MDGSLHCLLFLACWACGRVKAIMFTLPPHTPGMCSVQKQPTVSPVGPLMPLVTIDDVSDDVDWISSAQSVVLVSIVSAWSLCSWLDLKNYFKKARCILGRF